MCVKGEMSMINSVPKVNFCAAEGVNAQDLLNSPGQFATSVAPTPPDSFERQGEEEKKSKSGAAKAIIATLVVGLAAFAGLGYAVKKGKLDRTNVELAEGFFNKAWARIKNAGVAVGEAAGKCWDSTLGKFIGNEASKA